MGLDRQFHIPVSRLEPLLREAAQAGLDSDDILISAGLSDLAGAPHDLAPSLPLADFFRVEGEVARRLDDLTAHLSARKLTFETGAFVTAQMKRSTTLSEALTNLAQHFNMMHGEHYNTVRTTERTVTLIINDSDFPYTMKNEPDLVHFIGECVSIKVQCLLDSLSGGLAVKALRRVSVKRGDSAQLPGHLQFWPVPISFGQDNYELSFDRDLSHASLHASSSVDLSSEGLYSRVISYLEHLTPETGGQSFRIRTLDLVRGGITQQEEIARRLSVSVATLRRRLEAESTNFREIVNAHLMSEAVKLLEKGHSVAHVSETLDYSDIRAFNRAFKRWTGETPAKYAKRFEAVSSDV